MIVKNLEKKENSTAMFQVEVEADAFEKAVASAYKRMKGRIGVPGFRTGKVPRVVIEGMYGPEVFHEEAVSIIAPEAFKFAVDEEKLNSVGAPAIADFNVDENKACTITFMTDLYPEVTLGQYKELEGEYTEPAVTDEMVQEELEEARKRSARLVDVERPVQQGDTIVLDFEGFVDGEAFDGGKAEDFTLEIGSGSFIPGFEEQLIGFAPEQEGEINVTFPEHYNDNLAGKPATFKVKVHSVREPQYSELDDDFAKDVSEFDTFEEYRADILRRKTEELAARAESDFQSAVMYKAVENTTAAVPGSMVEDKLDDFLRNYAGSMGIPGNTPRDQILSMIGMSEDNFSQMMRPAAERQVKADLLLDKIVEVEAIEATQEDKDAFLKRVDEDYGEDAEKVRAMIDEELMAKDIARRKAADVIYNSAKKVAPSEEPEETAEPEAEAAPESGETAE